MTEKAVYKHVEDKNWVANPDCWYCWGRGWFISAAGYYTPCFCRMAKPPAPRKD